MAEQQVLALLTKFRTSGGGVGASINTFGMRQYTVAFYLTVGTGATPASCTVKIQFSSQKGTDGTIQWIDLAAQVAMFTVSLATGTAFNYAFVNTPLVKLRANVTAYVQATNGDDFLNVDLVAQR